MKLQHFSSCTADYPEKLADEPPQHLTRIELDDGEYVMQCVDCGAYVVVSDGATKGEGEGEWDGEGKWEGEEE